MQFEKNEIGIIIKTIHNTCIDKVKLIKEYIYYSNYTFATYNFYIINNRFTTPDGMRRNGRITA